MAERLYTHSRNDAVREGRLDRWERSREANIRCAHDIDRAVFSLFFFCRYKVRVQANKGRR